MPQPLSPKSLFPSTSIRTYAAVFALVVAGVVVVMQPWKSKPQPGVPLQVKDQDIFACQSTSVLKQLYPLLREGNRESFVREGQRLTTVGDCIYIGRGVQITGYQASDPRLFSVQRESGDRSWLAPKAVFEELPHR